LGFEHQRGQEWQHGPSIAVASREKPPERQASLEVLTRYDQRTALWRERTLA
jgi:hypothetical protein